MNFYDGNWYRWADLPEDVTREIRDRYPVLSEDELRAGEYRHGHALKNWGHEYYFWARRLPNPVHIERVVDLQAATEIVPVVTRPTTDCSEQMPNRRLTPDEIENARLLLTMVRAGLERLAGGDASLLFALRRKVYKELVYDERGKPMARRALKAQKRQLQGGLCAICSRPLPERYCVLDRLQAARGYTIENTRLICPECDISTQQSRGYA